MTRERIYRPEKRRAVLTSGILFPSVYACVTTWPTAFETCTSQDSMLVMFTAAKGAAVVMRDGYRSCKSHVGLVVRERMENERPHT